MTTWCGRVAKTRMHDPLKLLRNLPDWRAINLWYRRLRHDHRTATVLALITVIWRLSIYGDELSTPVGILVLSLLVAGLVAIGATFGGTLVYDYGFNVETAGDSPVWHKSETDVFPGDHD